MTHRLSLFSRALLLGCLGLLALPSHAQEEPSSTIIYKGLDAQGRVVYTNNPKLVKNPKRVSISPPPLEGVVSAPPATPASPAPQLRSIPNTAESDPGEPKEAAVESVEDAQAALDSARKALAQGQEPREGERLGTANGGSRLSDAYFSRLKQLEADVKKAQKNLDTLLTR